MSNIQHVLKIIRKNRKKLPYYFRYVEATETATSIHKQTTFLAASKQHATQQYVLEASTKPVFIP